MEKPEKFHTVRGYQLLEQDKKLLTSAMEDYLEMIYRNNLVEKYMRINTLSELLNVNPSSATKMVQKLSTLGLVNYKKYGIIFLTERGEEIGKFLLYRHETIESFLKYLGSNENVLLETELLEHNVTNDTLANLNLLNEFFHCNTDIFNKFNEFKKNYTINMKEP